MGAQLCGPIGTMTCHLTLQMLFTLKNILLIQEPEKKNPTPNIVNISLFALVHVYFDVRLTKGGCSPKKVRGIEYTFYST